MQKKKKVTSHQQNSIYQNTIIALSALAFIIWLLTGCTIQKEGCASTKGMSGYTNYKK